MGDAFRGRSCKYENSRRPAGSEVCVDGKCMICQNGKWKDKIEGLYPAAG